MWFVSFKGARNRKLVLTVSVENINEFLLFNSSNHDGSSFRVSR